MKGKYATFTCYVVVPSSEFAAPSPGIIVGSVGAVITLLVSKLMLRYKIDDVVDAVAVHLGCGTWSALSAPFFVNTKGKLIK